MPSGTTTLPIMQASSSNPSERPRQPVDLERADQLDALVEDPSVPTLVCFLATRSTGGTRPGRLLKPELDKLAGRVGDDLNVVRVDPDRWPTLIANLKVYQLPAVLLFSAGQELARIHGAPSADVLERFVDFALERANTRRDASDSLEYVAQ